MGNRQQVQVKVKKKVGTNSESQVKVKGNRLRWKLQGKRRKEKVNDGKKNSHAKKKGDGTG